MRRKKTYIKRSNRNRRYKARKRRTLLTRGGIRL